MSVGIRRPLSIGMASLCVLVGGLVLVSAPALAAAPEAPVTGEANPVTTTTATLNGELGELNPENVLEVGTYEFLYRESATTCEAGKTAPVPAGMALSKESVSQALTGLLPGTTYTFCLLARNATGETALGSPVTFTTHGAGITEEQVVTVEASAATLQADIDPNESETRYRFEYDTVPYTSSATHGVSITGEGENTEVNVGSGTTPVPAEVRLKGLQPSTVYYYRVVAVNEGGTFDGPGKAFTTNPAPESTAPESCPNETLRAEQQFGLTLPECRAYELVSPEETGGRNASEPGLFNRASLSGDALTYTAKGAAFAAPGGSTLEDQFLARRGAGGWSTEAISPPFYEREGFATFDPYQGLIFTPELSAGITFTNVSLAAGAPEQYGLYRANFAAGVYSWITDQPDAAEQEQLYKEQLEENHVYTNLAQFSIVGASSDLSHVVYGYTTCESPGCVGSSEVLYEWSGGTAARVDVGDRGEPIPARAGAGSDSYGGSATETDLWNAVSSDGDRVYFTNWPSGGRPTLYLRENPEAPQSPIGGERCTDASDACTVQVDTAEPGASGPSGGGRFWGASADGETVFFTDENRLTINSTAEAGEPDLYEYEVGSGRLRDLTVAAGGGHADVLGVVQPSEDGSYVYFVARGVLSLGPNAQGGEPVAGQPNLYVSHEGGGPVFIATLAERDHADWYESGAGALASPAHSTAAVSPDGSLLAFVSSRGLTGYDNGQAAPGDCEGKLDENLYKEEGHCGEVFVYDAASGGLRCASCDPTGARPLGPSSLNVRGGGGGGETPLPLEYKPRSFAEDGTLFFQSSDALVPQDTDGMQDVYAYREGHVHALSDVAGDNESYLLDVSASGDDVFIATADRLLPQDRGGRIAVYDARVDGGFPASPAALECDNGDSCKPPASVQPSVFGAPASATFSGSGNATPAVTATVTAKKKTAAQLKAEKLAKALRQCRKQRQPKRNLCEASARKRYGATKAKQAKRATSDRRASR